MGPRSSRLGKAERQRWRWLAGAKEEGRWPVGGGAPRGVGEVRAGGGALNG
jgi:hypothetical protein